MTHLKLLPHRSDSRLAALVCQKILHDLSGIQSFLDIGCGDGAFGQLLTERYNYRGIDLSNASIYQRDSTNARITYTEPEKLESTIQTSDQSDCVLLLDVLEHTRTFTRLFELALPLAKKFVVVSLPNELFILDRLRFLAGREHPAHSLDLINRAEGFKHQYLINVDKASLILDEIAGEYGFVLTEEWLQPLTAKNNFVQPALWLLRKLSSKQVWSMGSILIFQKRSG